MILDEIPKAVKPNSEKYVNVPELGIIYKIKVDNLCIAMEIKIPIDKWQRSYLY